MVRQPQQRLAHSAGALLQHFVAHAPTHNLHHSPLPHTPRSDSRQHNANHAIHHGPTARSYTLAHLSPSAHTEKGRPPSCGAALLASQSQNSRASVGGTPSPCRQADASARQAGKRGACGFGWRGGWAARWVCRQAAPHNACGTGLPYTLQPRPHSGKHPANRPATLKAPTCVEQTSSSAWWRPSASPGRPCGSSAMSSSCGQ